MTVVDLNTDDARRRTDRIKLIVDSLQESLDKLATLIQEAYTERDWLALGYENWDTYVQSEFGTDRLKLDRDERQDLVVQLRSGGMSTRAIGSALGIGKSTVDRDLDEATVPDGTDGQPDNVISLDGRRRPATRPGPKPDTPDDDIIEGEVVGDESPPRPKSDDPSKPRSRQIQKVLDSLTAQASTYELMDRWPNPKATAGDVDAICDALDGLSFQAAGLSNRLGGVLYEALEDVVLTDGEASTSKAEPVVSSCGIDNSFNELLADVKRSLRSLVAGASSMSEKDALGGVLKRALIRLEGKKRK